MNAIHIPAVDSGHAAYVRSVCSGMGVSTTPLRAQSVVAFTDIGASAAPWVSRDPLIKLHDRIAQQEIAGHMPSISAASDFSSLTGPVFIKPRDSMRDRNPSPLAYTHYENSTVAALACAGRLNGELEKLVVQPSVGVPSDILTIDFAVNADGGVYPFQALVQYDWSGRNGISRCESVPVPGGAIVTLQNVTAVRGLKSSIHHAQFAKLDDKWLLIDWNPRLSLLYDNGFWDADGIIASAIRFMLGSSEMPAPPYVQQRNYRERVVPPSAVAAAQSMGFVLRQWHRYSKNLGLDALAWHGDKATADAKFSEFEALL